jgi:lysine 6-dehydrogenase
MRGVDVVACALPYHFNLEMTRLAIDVGAHVCDLGGNTEIVSQQKELSDLAKGACVRAVPDCCSAPGIVNVLAQGGIDVMDEAESVEILVGGLPKHPKPPLNYQVV